ncbi:MAG: MEDS domain-containing protein [Deltaproteobacteria bacterium]|nr:MEDS domain-containing protein [Deltaproteobacteria bacterium]
MKSPPLKPPLEAPRVDMQPGSHACFLYENDAEHRRVLTPFIRTGLSQNEKVLYLTHAHSLETILSYLSDDGLDPAPFIQSGQLFITPAEDFFENKSGFDPEAAVEQLQYYARQARDAGYSALRVTLETSWGTQLADSEAFSRFETRLDAWIPGSNTLWLCQYDRNKTASVFLLNALTAHPDLFIGIKCIENFYYIPPRERLGFDSEDTILDNWIQNLIRRKKAEDALEARIRFQELIMHISAGFVESGVTDIQIQRALETIGEFTGVDRAYLFQARSDEGLFDNTHEWCAPGITPQIQKLQGIAVEKELPWFWKRLHTDGLFHIPDVFEMPDEGHLEQKHFEAQQIQSLIVVPIASGGSFKGFLGFDAVRERMAWPEEIVLLLRITGQILCSFLDRKAAENAAREREARYATLTENLNIGVYRTAGPSGDRFLEANTAMARIFGCETREEFSKIKPSKTFQDPKDRIQLLDKLSARGQLRNEEIQLLKKDRTPFTASTSIVAIRNPEGKIDYFDGVLEDVTEQKQIQEAVRRSEQKFRDLFNSVSDLIYTQDLEGRFLSFNQALLHILGYTPEELIGRPASDFMKPELKLLYRSEYLQKILEEGRCQGVTIYFAKDGRKIYLEYRSVLVKPEGQAPYISGIARDVTEKMLSERKIKGLEEQILHSKKMQAIGTLAGGIAHDFNNILGIILGNAELALEDVVEKDPVRHHLEEIQTASLRARDVVKQLLSFSRKTEHERKPLRLSPLIKESLKLLRASIPADIAIETRLDETAATVLTDPGQIHQVLINLCTNAAHAMEETGGTLTLRLENHVVESTSPSGTAPLTTGRYVKLTVEDTGSGIDARHLDRIFDPYFTTKEMGKGTGLGLSVVHGIVKDHKGEITVESRPGSGTLFSIYLPAYAGEATHEAEKAATLPTGSERILFVDDEASIVEIGTRLLERLGYRVEGHTHPLDALARFSEDPHGFDLVITDMTMPHLTGDRFIKEILALRPQTPVILCTGFSARINAESAARLGVRCYLEKPLNWSELARSVRKAVEE